MFLSERRSAMYGLILSAALAAASPVPAFAEEPHTFDIKATAENARAIQDFGIQSGIQILASAEQLQGRKLHEVTGSHTTDVALRILLADTGLTHKYVGDRTVALVKADEAPSASAKAPGAKAPGATGPDAAAADTAAHSAEPKQSLEEIVITGSHIAGQWDSSSPLDVIDRREIERSGLTSLPDLIATVTGNSGGGINTGSLLAGVTTQNAYNNRGYASGPNLRGLGSEATLTLLNGHRLPIASSGYSVDLSSIPLAAIDHIDILKDGASSIYGSDAVGGVINVVTRSDFHGAETRLTGASVTDGSKMDYQASQLLGHEWSTGSGMLAYTYDRQDSLFASDRAFARDATPGNVLIPGSRSNSVYGALNQRFSDALSMTADVLYNDRDTPIDAGFVNNGTFYDKTGNSRVETSIVTAGLRYRFLEDWSVSLDGLHSRSETDYVSDDERNGLTVNNYRGRSSSAEISLSGGVLKLPGGTVKIALGSVYRDERFGADGSIDGEPSDNFELSRNIFAGYAELNVPLVGTDNRLRGVEKLQLDGSVRYERYSDFGSTTTPKFGLLWHPVAGWQVRSTYSKSFRAPLLAELGQANFNLLLELPDPLSPTGSSVSVMRTGGNTSLGSQNARSWTSGVRWSDPAGALSINLDYYDIRFKGLIEAPNGGFPTQMEPDVYGAFLQRNPSAPVTTPIVDGPNFLNFYGPFTPSDIQLIVDIRLQNLAALETSGVDASVDYRLPSSAGDFTGSLDATYITSYRQTVVEGQPSINLRSTTYYPVNFRARASLGWESGPWSVTGYLNYLNSYENTADPTLIVPVDSWTTADLQFSYKARPTAGAVFSGSELALSARNIFNRDPPFVRNPSSGTATSSQINYDPVNASPLGRYLSLRLTKRW